MGKGKRKKFNEEELKGIEGYEKGKNYVEVECGCTNKKYGDFGGKLRISVAGQFLITCHCFEGCEKGKLLYIFYHSLIILRKFKKITELYGYSFSNL